MTAQQAIELGDEVHIEPLIKRPGLMPDDAPTKPAPQPKQPPKAKINGPTRSKILGIALSPAPKAIPADVQKYVPEGYEVATIVDDEYRPVGGIAVLVGKPYTPQLVENTLLHVTQCTKFESYQIKHNRYYFDFERMRINVLKGILGTIFNSDKTRINYSWAAPIQDLILKYELFQKKKIKEKKTKDKGNDAWYDKKKAEYRAKYGGPTTTQSLPKAVVEEEAQRRAQRPSLRSVFLDLGSLPVAPTEQRINELTWGEAKSFFSTEYAKAVINEVRSLNSTDATIQLDLNGTAFDESTPNNPVNE